MALLHATAAAAAQAGLQVWALHVHHGLMPEADAWWVSVERRCARWRQRGWPVHFAGERLVGQPAPGQSVEAWARQGRYEALARMARVQGIGLVLLAHHRRDQAETVLLQALRSGGPSGLSAMPHTVNREGILWVRPWLNQPREAIEAYVRRHRIRYVDDPSNDHGHLARNRLRHQAWDALARSFPHAEVALAGAARRMQEAAACLADLAALDMTPCVNPQGALGLAEWARLSAPRRANVLRHWAAMHLPKGMPETLVERLLAQAVAASNGSWWPAPGGRVCRERGGLVFVPGAVSKAASGAA